MSLIETFAAACDYPSRLDVGEVESRLREYAAALGHKYHKVSRLESAWNLADHPSLERQVNAILNDFSKRGGYQPAASDARNARAARAASDARNARAARAARAALDARAARDARAIQRFAQWCVQAGGWWYWRFEISWIAATHIGAVQNKAETVLLWSRPLFDAFVAGCWLIHWTDDTIYWVAKPTVHVERGENVRRMHNSTGPALESDVENLYFWHGVLVPAYVVTNPELITVEEIESEANAEVRRILIERYGQSKYLLDSGAKKLHEDDWGILYRKEIPGDEPLVMVKVVNSTRESDGTFKDYFLRVQPELRPMLEGGGLGEPQKLTALNAVASTFGKTGKEYLPRAQT